MMNADRQNIIAAEGFTMEHDILDRIPFAVASVPHSSFP
jgi:hypothetical protein